MRSLPSALDVAEFILQERGPQDALKLQKLVYYVQAHSLGDRQRTLFRERIEAWVHGPVVPALYQMQTGYEPSITVGGNVRSLSAEDCAFIREVLLYYCDKSPVELRGLTHDEDPWKAARAGLTENQPSTNQISPTAMRRFYAIRPWGGAMPVTDLSCFSRTEFERAKKDLAAGRVIRLGASRSQRELHRRRPSVG